MATNDTSDKDIKAWHNGEEVPVTFHNGTVIVHIDKWDSVSAISVLAPMGYIQDEINFKDDGKCSTISYYQSGSVLCNSDSDDEIDYWDW